MHRDWDIFCSVVDNYGDIGVAWRLARALTRRGVRVRLWVDDLQAFQRLRPAVDPDVARQLHADVTVCAWPRDWQATPPARVVIEAFGCALPDAYVAAMATCEPAPVWVNLEYLSAEAWVASHHGLPSPHPRLPLCKYFFFPGYGADTGGLLVDENDGIGNGADALALWQALGLPTPAAGELRVSLFAYENPALPAQLDAWCRDPHSITCLVPEGRVLPQIARWLGVPQAQAGDTFVRGSLRLIVLPFLDQDRYDQLLQASDLNFVRGEDSCVRAQAAARPLVWQAYPQSAGTHWEKLDALLARYTAALDPAVADALSAFWRRWNGVPTAPEPGECWRRWRLQRTAIAAAAEAWRGQLAKAGNLADKLVEFVEIKLK